MGIPMLKIRRSLDRLIFNMGIPIVVRRHLYIEPPPPCLVTWRNVQFIYWQLWMSLCNVSHPNMFARVRESTLYTNISASCVHPFSCTSRHHCFATNAEQAMPLRRSFINPSHISKQHPNMCKRSLYCVQEGANKHICTGITCWLLYKVGQHWNSSVHITKVYVPG